MTEEMLTLELKVLGWAGLLLVVQLLLALGPATAQVGLSYLAGPRDEPRDLTGLAGRLERAYRNHIEWLLPYAIAAVLISWTGASTPFTETCAWAYLAARVVYVPIYAAGIPWIRTLVWAVGFLATLAILLAALY